MSVVRGRPEVARTGCEVGFGRPKRPLLSGPERASIKVSSPASQNKNEEFRKQKKAFHKKKIKCPEGTPRDPRACSMHVMQEVAMAAIARALSHPFGDGLDAFQSADELDVLKQIALLCGADSGLPDLRPGSPGASAKTHVVTSANARQPGRT